ncbi:caspase domain-containing protein [Trichophaea hybrida]|nr:caspase domain-containing protein [Trichophaea hybrida]
MSVPDILTPIPRQWFALIGIDFYMPGTNRQDDQGLPISFPSLRGCVHDVNQVKDFIEARFPNDSRITTLTSTRPEDGAKLPTEEATSWPTHNNIIGLLKKITCDAVPGDLVHIHYSGHGARVQGIHRGEIGLYKALVPLDMGCGGQYLYDVEIKELLNAMVDKNLTVTIVLDCCHSGNGARNFSNEPSDPRGISQIDATEIAQTSSSECDTDRRIDIRKLQDWSTLAESPESRVGRGFRVNTSDAPGFELLAACRVDEQAYELCYDSVWQGVLTYNLLKSLKTGVNVTHGMLHRRLVALVNGSSNRQTPDFMGDSQRYFFSSNRIDNPSVTPITVKKLLNEQYLVLDIGLAHAMLEKNEFAIYPWYESDFSDSSDRPRVRVTEVWPLESKAEVINIGQLASDHPIEPGSQAMSVKSLVLGLPVKFSGYFSGTSRCKFDQLREEIKSCNVQHHLARLASCVTLVSESDRGAAYHIGVENDHYKLLDTADRPIRHFPSSMDPKDFLHSLWHLARFKMCRGLKNTNVPKNLIGKFTFELEVAGEPVPPTTTRYHLNAGTLVNLRFENKSKMPLYLTIFDFGPSWHIEKIYPVDADYRMVDVGSSVSPDGEFEMFLPDNWDPKSPDPIDCFKAFITTHPSSFHPLELPRLSPDGNAPKGASSYTGFELQGLLKDLTPNTLKQLEEDASNTIGRHVQVSNSCRGTGWVTAEIEVCTKPIMENVPNPDDYDPSEEFQDCLEYNGLKISG